MSTNRLWCYKCENEVFLEPGINHVRSGSCVMSAVPTRYSPHTNVAAGESGDSSDSEDSRDDNGKPRGQISLKIQFCKSCTTFTEFYNLNLMFLNGDQSGVL